MTQMQISTEQSPFDALVALLRHQRSLVLDLVDLARTQRELIESCRTEALLGLLAQRQRLIDRFVASQDDLSAFNDKLGARFEQLPDEQRGQVTELVDEIGSALSDVMSHDARDQSLLETRRDATRDEIQSLDRGKKAHRAYVKPHGGNRFTDRQG